MAEEQACPDQANIQDGSIEQNPDPNVLITEIKEVDPPAGSKHSAAENYNEIASKLFESSEVISDNRTDGVADVNQESSDVEPHEDKMMQDDKDIEQVVQKVHTNDQTVLDGPSEKDEDQPVVTIEQVETEDTAGNDVQNESVEHAADHHDTVTNVDTGIQPNITESGNAVADDNKQVNVSGVDTAVAVDSAAVDSNDRLSEDDIINKLQEVNQQVYKDDKTTLGNEQSDLLVQPKDSSTNQNGAQGDADTGATQDESIIGGVSGPGGDAMGPDDALVATNDEDLTELTDNHNTEHTAQMSEVMSEDLDAMPVSSLYQNYTGKEGQEAAMSENKAAISDAEQQRDGLHHVTYADLPNPNGALSNSSQVCLSKRSHGQVAHQCRGPNRQLPQTAPSRLSMNSITKQIPQIPSPPGANKGDPTLEQQRLSRKNSHKLPPSLMRMSTVMVSARKRAILNRQASVYFEEKQTSKVVTLDQCINSRPPLPFDLDTPGPWHYSPRNKPLYETNAPEYSMGCKLYERDGGGRTAWAKSWFNSPDNFTRKVRWEKRWPSPNNYSSRSPLLGRPQASMKSYPQFSIGIRSNFTINKRGSEQEPAPCHYNREKADNLTMRSAPSFSMRQRHDKTTLGKTIETTPCPTAYKPAFKHMSSHVHYPSFTIRGVRKQKIHALGPHSTL